MEIRTKFNLGNSVWTIRNCKAAEVEIAAMTIDINGVWIRSKEDYAAFHEDNCFTSKEALIKHISGDDGNESM